MQVQQAVRVAYRQTDACRSANLLVIQHGEPLLILMRRFGFGFRLAISERLTGIQEFGGSTPLGSIK